MRERDGRKGRGREREMRERKGNQGRRKGKESGIKLSKIMRNEMKIQSLNQYLIQKLKTFFLFFSHLTKSIIV